MVIEPKQDLNKHILHEKIIEMTFIDPANTFTVNLVFIFRLLQYKVVVNRHI